MKKVEELQTRIDALEVVARSLTRDQVISFSTAVREATAGAAWPADERFWHSGTGRARLTKADEAALAKLWTRMLAGE